MATYKWDVEELQSDILRLDMQRESINSIYTRLENQLKILPEIFVGEAGTAFYEKLSSNLISLQEYGDAVEELEGKMITLVRKHYKPCEDKIEEKINRFRNNM